MMRFVFPVFVALAAAAWANGQTAPDTGSSVYAKVVRSTVWVHSRRPNALATGSGTLIDQKHRLVLTNFHVVGEENQANVLFPQYRDGQPIAERGYYTQRQRDLGIPGRVFARDRQRDLSIIQLDRVPAGVPALSLADKTVTPGQTVHSIGNPGSSGALWLYTPGKVRQVYMKRWQAELDGRIANFHAEVVETDSATNPGDSGGPLVNDAGQLIGVTQGAATKAQLLSTFIDISEVKKFLNASETRRVTGWEGSTNPERTTAVRIRDGGRFFAEATVKNAQDSANQVFAKHRLDMVVETYSQIPGNRSPEVKAMKAEDKKKFFEHWAHERLKALDAVGIIMLTTRDPQYLIVQISHNPRIKVEANEGESISAAVRNKFRDGNFDDGLKVFTERAAALLSGAKRD